MLSDEQKSVRFQIEIEIKYKNLLYHTKMRSPFQNSPSTKNHFHWQITPLKVVCSILILCTILVSPSKAQSTDQCCLEVSSSDPENATYEPTPFCLKCPELTHHLYRGNCIFNVPHCLQYKMGFDCIQCRKGYKLNQTLNICIKQKLEITMQPQENQGSQNEQNQRQQILDDKNESEAEIGSSDKDQNAQQSPQCSDHPIELPLNQISTNVTVQRASVANEIFKSQYPEIQTLTLLRAYDRQFIENGTKYIVLVYGHGDNSQQIDVKSENPVYYEGVMLADIETFIFKEKSWRVISKEEYEKEFEENENNHQLPAEKKENHQILNQQSNKNQKNQSNSQENDIEVQSFEKGKGNKNHENQQVITNPDEDIKQQENEEPFQDSSVDQKAQASHQLQPQNTQNPSMRYATLSETEALMDIYYVVCLNQIMQDVPMLQDLNPPKQIKVQETHKRSQSYHRDLGKQINYLVKFVDNQERTGSEGGDKVQGYTEYTVSASIDPTTYVATVDNVDVNLIEQQGQQPAEDGPTPSTSSDGNQHSDPTPNIGQEEGSDVRADRSQYQEISVNPNEADIYFLVFLSTLTEKHQELFNNKQSESSGVSVNSENEIIYAGQKQSEEYVHYFLEIESSSRNLPSENGQKGSQADLKGEEQERDGSVRTEVWGSIKKATYEVKIERVNKRASIADNTDDSQLVMDQSGPQGQKTVEDESIGVVEQGLSSPSIEQQEEEQNPSNQRVLPPSQKDPQLQEKQAQTQQQKQAPLQEQAQQQEPIVGDTVKEESGLNQSDSTAPPAMEFIDDIIEPLASGFDALTVQEQGQSEAVNKIVATLQQSNRILRDQCPHCTLYRAYMKNFGIKQEYKLYFIDWSSNSQAQWEGVSLRKVYQGYATFDLFRKRVFIMRFGSVNGSSRT